MPRRHPHDGEGIDAEHGCLLRVDVGGKGQQVGVADSHPLPLEGVAAGDSIILNAGTSAIARLTLAVARRRGILAVAIVRDASAEGTLKAAGAVAVLVVPTLLKKFEAPLWRRYPEWRTMARLRFSANAYIGARTPSP